MLSQIQVLYYHLTVTGNSMYSLLFVNRLDLVSGTFACPVRPLHTHWQIILSGNLVTEIQKKLTHNKVGTNCFYSRYVVKNTHFDIYSSGAARAVTMSLSESDFCMVIRLRHFTLAQMLTGWTGVALTLCDKSGTASGMGETMWLSAWRFSKPTLTWLVPCQDVTCGIWDCPGTISKTCISSPNVVGDGVAAVASVWVFRTAGTLSSVVPKSVSLSWKE